MKQIHDFSEAEIQQARTAVAEQWREIARSYMVADDFPPHVTQEVKESMARREKAFAAEIEAGLQDHCFTVAQRIHFELTGESVPLLPKYHA